MLCRRTKRASESCSIRRTGFSLVELIVVMVIIAMLAGIVTLSTRSYLISARQSEAKAELKTLTDAVDTYYSTNGRYPSSEDGLETLTISTEKAEAPIKKIPDDPWGNPYEYYNPGRDGEPYEIVCLGGDGREGGEGEAKDFSNLD